MTIRHFVAISIVLVLVGSAEVFGGDLSGAYVNFDQKGSCGGAPLNRLSGYRTLSQRSASYIVNGIGARQGDWPSLVFVKIAGLHCSGVIIRPDVVLTAGHCLNRVIPLRYPDRRELEEGVEGYVTVGLTNRFAREQQVVVHKVGAVQKGGFYRERGISQVEADLGRVFLRDPIEFNQYVQAACVPSTAEAVDRLLETRNFPLTFVVGYGGYKRFNETYFYMPREAQVLQVRKTTCVERQYFETDICMAPIDNKNRGICRGDSGGPVLVLDQNKRWSVVALATGAYACSATRPKPVAGLDRYLKLSKVVEILRKDYKRFPEAGNRHTKVQQ